MMRRGPRSGQTDHEPILDRLDRVARDINPFLIVIVIGLAVLNFSVFTALELPRLPLR